MTHKKEHKAHNHKAHKTATESSELKKGSRVKLLHTGGEELGAVVDHVQDDGLVEVTIDHEGHELHGKKTVVRQDGLVGGDGNDADEAAADEQADEEEQSAQEEFESEKE